MARCRQGDSATMTPDELRKAMDEGEEIEYHLMGMEHGPYIGAPGWYSCVVMGFHPNGNAEIIYTSPDLDDMGCTVLKRNFASAFRHKAVHVDTSSRHNVNLR